MPVAKIKTFDIVNFVKVASHCHTQNIDTIYVIARGLNIGLAGLVVSEIEKAKMYLKNMEWEYDTLGKRGQIRTYIAEMHRV